MEVAIIGSGNVDSAFAQCLLKSGHQVSFGVRDASSAKSEKASSLEERISNRIKANRNQFIY